MTALFHKGVYLGLVVESGSAYKHFLLRYTRANEKHCHSLWIKEYPLFTAGSLNCV